MRFRRTGEVQGFDLQSVLRVNPFLDTDVEEGECEGRCFRFRDANLLGRVSGCEREERRDSEGQRGGKVQMLHSRSSFHLNRQRIRA